MLRDRRWWLGGAAVAVLALGAWLLMPARIPEAATERPARGRTAPPADVEAEPLRPVKLDALTASREQPQGTARNPFRFQPRVVPPSPPPAAPPRPEGDKSTGPPVATGPPPPPPIPFKFIGIVTRENGVKWAVLSDGRVTVHGKDGDIIDGRYRIVKIGTESIELTYADGRGRQTVRLTGQ
jgi:hypothetical protein